MRSIAFRLLLPVALSLSLLPGSPCAAAPDARVAHLFILSFDSWGELLNPGERDLAIEQLRRDPSIDRIVVFSYGWGHDANASYADYLSMMNEIDRNLPEGHARPNVAVIGVGWDSSQTGFRKMLNAIVPLPGVANAIAWPVDQLLFPISFWSKAAQADRIGFDGLRGALNDIFAVYEGRADHPEIFLIGHSFGTRIISGLMKASLGPIDLSANTFRAAPHVRGALLFQPALVGGNLDHEAEYPILITMSQHDHAVGFLYPVANVPLNALGFTMFEALVQRLLLEPVKTGLDVTRSTLPGDVEVPGEPGALMETAVRKSWRTLGEFLALPLNVAFTAVTLPIDYLYIQGTQLATRPVGQLMDTLAQLPVVEIPVDGLSRWMERDVPWGRRGKGLFTLGSIHEGMGRMSPPLALYPDPEVYTPAQLNDFERLPSGPFVVDASERISTGAFGVDLSNPLADYTLGWLDPIAAHSDFTNARALELAAWMASGGRVKLKEPVADPAD